MAEDSNGRKKLKVRYCRPSSSCEKSSNRISLMWWSGWFNFGDMLSPVIVQALSGCHVDHVSTLAPRTASCTSPYLLAAGSILERARDGDIIWGTGHKGQEQDTLPAKALDVRAVRGPHTRRYLLNKGIPVPEIYGDPAILMPRLYTPRHTNTSLVGVIAHYSDLTDWKKLGNASIKIISVRNDPLTVIDEISSCDCILSSSLHGLILAEAYGKSAVWLYPKAELWQKARREPWPKYHDYYLSTSREPWPYEYDQKSFDWEGAMKLARRWSHSEETLKKLLFSFPFLREDVKSLSDLDRYKIAGLDPL